MLNCVCLRDLVQITCKIAIHNEQEFKYTSFTLENEKMNTQGL